MLWVYNKTTDKNDILHENVGFKLQQFPDDSTGITIYGPKNSVLLRTFFIKSTQASFKPESSSAMWIHNEDDQVDAYLFFFQTIQGQEVKQEDIRKLANLTAKCLYEI